MINLSASSIAGLAFLIIALLVGVISVVLSFHWKKYGMGGFGLLLAESLYFAGVALFLGVAFYSLN